MAKSDFSSNPLIPIVLVAGVLSGSLWRGTPPADTGKPGESSELLHDAGDAGEKCLLRDGVCKSNGKHRRRLVAFLVGDVLPHFRQDGGRLRWLVRQQRGLAKRA